jgi:hypothetical protein
MEPTDFDKLLRNKLNEGSDLYSKEIEHSKPFVWTAVQQNLNSEKSLIRWQHLAAAVILLLVSSTSIIYFMNKQHQREMNQLANSIDSMHSNYLIQSKQLQQKDELLSCFQSDIQSLQQFQNKVLREDNFVEKTQYVYQTDTVFVEEIRYITEQTIKESSDDSIEQVMPLESRSKIDPNSKIYPVYKTSKSSNNESENIKLKLNSIASN